MMPEPKEEPLRTVDESEDTTVSLPVDADDNDEPNADASGDSEDEKADENEAPEEWLEGELQTANLAHHFCTCERRNSVGV